MNVRMSLAGSVALAALWTCPALAQEAPAAGTVAGQAAEQVPTGDARSEDVIVTAQKRAQSLIEVPQSVSVIGGEVLERQGAVNLADYARLIPGLQITQDNPGETRLILRGINTGSVASTVAVYIDDTPFGASSSFSNSAIQAGDVDTFDIARVEVLRGPQGTLYGANALGGVLKYVTAAPSTEKFELRAQGGVEDVRDGGTGYIGNAVVNVPLGDTLAFRANGFYKKLAGYIDTTGRAGNDVNDSEIYGGRASLLFQPTSALTVRLFGLYQNIDTDSPSTFDADPNTLKPISATSAAPQGEHRTRFELYPEANNARYRYGAGTISYDFGGVSLTSVTSYAEQKLLQVSDISVLANGLLPTVNALYPTPAGDKSLIFRNNLSLRKFTQEVRLASADNDTFEWLIGGYYTHEKTRLFQRYEPFVIASQVLIPRAITVLGPTIPEFVTASIRAKYEEYAGFGSATLHLGPRFDITAGGRYSHNDQTSTQAVVQLGQGDPNDGDSSEGVFTWSVAPRFEVSDRVAVYGRAAKGYRPGGPNFIPPGATADFPANFDSDSLTQYEIGLKAETADRMFGIDVAAFYIDWDDILVTSVADSAAGPVGVNANGRRARSKGFEINLTARPTTGLSTIMNVAYTDAYLRDSTAPRTGGPDVVGGLPGDQLPYSPRWQATGSIDYEWNLSGSAKAFVGGNVHLQSDQSAGFDPDYRAAIGRRLRLDGYATVDLRAGVEINNITIQAYAKNLNDEYALVSAAGYPFTVPTSLGGRNVDGIQASTIRPRTIGALVGVKF